KGGKVDLPPSGEPPANRTKLLRRHNGRRWKNYMQNISLNNSMFAFTSMGGKVDTEINNGRGRYIFVMNGQKYHRIGTLLPEGKDEPRTTQLYTYDATNEVKSGLTHQHQKTKGSQDILTLSGALKNVG
uniref:Uncharacterized protein n=4 Tax=Aegilops tauschii subsp. strangulata TaxID=200361 RepID=A0A453ETN3_AEGTS